MWKFDRTSLQWAWISGSEASNATGFYGAKGVAATANVPGARYSSLSWFDSYRRQYFVFGGEGNTNGSFGVLMSDLWKFSTSTSQWTWVSGTTLGNQRQFVSTPRNFGPPDIPGARRSGTVWFDPQQDYVWLGFGYGYDGASPIGDLNDIWKFNLATSEFAAFAIGAGPRAPNHRTKGVEDALADPGTRSYVAGWIDIANGYLYTFGGYSGANYYNDVFRWNAGIDSTPPRASPPISSPSGGGTPSARPPDAGSQPALGSPPSSQPPSGVGAPSTQPLPAPSAGSPQRSPTAGLAPASSSSPVLSPVSMVVIPPDTVINGTFNVPPGTTVTVRIGDSGNPLVVEGCVAFGGNLTVAITPTLQLRNGSLPIILFDGYCPGGPTTFGTVVVDYGCNMLTNPQPHYNPKSMSIAFDAIEPIAGCSPPGTAGIVGGLSVGALAGIIVAAVIIAAVIIGFAILYFCRASVVPALKADRQFRKASAEMKQIPKEVHV